MRVIDLESGALRDGRPDDGITRVAPVTYDAAAACPRWEQFIGEIFARHPDLPPYIQRVIGYMITGLTLEQAIWILFGQGANGKSTLIETLMRAIFDADLAWTMPFPSASWTDALSDYQKAMLAGRRRRAGLSCRHLVSRMHPSRVSPHRRAVRKSPRPAFSVPRC